MSSSSEEEQAPERKRYKTYLDPYSGNVGIPPRSSRYRIKRAATAMLPGPSGDDTTSRNRSMSPDSPVCSGNLPDHPSSSPSSSDSGSSAASSSADEESLVSSDEESEGGDANLDALLAEEEAAEEDPLPEGPPVDVEAAKHTTYSEKYFLDAIINPAAHLTRFEILTLIQHFNMRFGLSNRGVVGLLELVNTILGEQVIPPSHYIFQEIFLTNNERTFHFYCPQCFMYICEDEPPPDTHCPDCNTVINGKTTGPSTNYFLTLPLESQLRRKLEEHGPQYINFMRNRVKNADVLSDVFDGLLYQDLHQSKSISDTDFTGTFNTDGANIKKSNRKDSAWPLQFRLNEIDPNDRYSVNNIILLGVSFGKAPKMSTYLTPFIKELKKLANQGLIWYNREANEYVRSKIYLLQSSLDTPAKAKVLRMKQFNGLKGCYICSHPGKVIGHNQVRYDTDNHKEEKTNEGIRADMMAAQQTGVEVNGQKGASPLICLKYFSFPFSVVIDVMHSHFLGVCKALVSKIWTNSTNHGQDYYLDPDAVKELDRRIMAMTPPSEISREPRPITQHKDWKANEWRNWLFYYGPVVLKGLLPNRYVKHFCLLSCSIYILSQKEISRYDLPIVHEYLQTFVNQYQDYYGEINMTSNVHLTTHLKSCVIWCGPLWCYSAFQFEAMNGVIVDFVHGTTGIPQEIARRCITFCKLPKTISLHPPLSDVVISYCEFVLSSGCPRYKKFTSLNDGTIIGDKWSEQFDPTAEERHLISQQFEDINLEDLFAVKKIFYQKFLITAGSTGKYRNDTVIKLKNSNYAKITKIFFSTTAQDQIFLLLNEINIENTAGNSFDTKFHIKKCQPYAFDELSVCKLTDVAVKSIFISYDGENKHVSEFPNRYEKD